MAGSIKKIVDGVFWTTLLNIVNGIYGFISIPLLLSYFGKSDYGLIGLTMSINVYLQLMNLGFNSTNIRFFSNWLAKKDYDKVGRLFQTSLSFYGIIGLINGLILFIISIYSEDIFHLTTSQDLILKHLLYVLVISAVVSWYSSCFDQLVKANENVAWVQRRTLIPTALQIIVLICTIYCQLSIELYYVLTTFSLFLIIPLTIGKIIKEIPNISFIPKFDKVIFKEILPYCISIFSFGIFQFSVNNLRPVFLGMQGTIESVTDYRILNGIVALVTMVGGAFMGVILPSASKVVALGDKAAQNKIAYDGTKYISILLCLCCFGAITISRQALFLYVGKDYLYLVPWLNLWLLTVLMTHNQAISSLILSRNDIKDITYMTAVASTIGLLLSWFLIPYYKIGGVIIAYAIYGSLQIIFYYTYYWPKVMHLNSWKILKSSFLPFVIYGSILYSLIDLSFSFIVLKNNFILLLLKGGMFTTGYLLCVYFFSINKDDKMFILKILKK